MAANPISFLEIGAYSQLMRVRLSAWEVGVIRRLDAVVLGQAAPPPTRPEPIPAADGERVSTLLRAVAARKNRRRRPRTQGGNHD